MTTAAARADTAEGSIWSPDGRYLAYWGNWGCQNDDSDAWGNVMISDPEGNVVASFPGQGWLISWSPDSTRVAVWILWGETIGVYGLDGERQTVLTVPPGMMAPGDYDPVWLPDGESLMVPYGVEVPLDGSTPRKLPWADAHEGWATYSPDGSRVAYSPDSPAAARTTPDGSLVVAAADGSHPREVSGDWTTASVTPYGRQPVIGSPSPRGTSTYRTPRGRPGDRNGDVAGRNGRVRHALVSSISRPRAIGSSSRERTMGTAT